MMGHQHSSTVDALVDSWLACWPATQDTWIVEHRARLDLALLEGLKARSDNQLRSAPQTADHITQAMLHLAQHMTDEPLAYPLACWARGNWLAYHDPQQAVIHYQVALDGYRPTGNQAILLGLLANLLIVSAEVNLSLAWEIYQQIEPLRTSITAEQYPLLLRIEQNSGIVLRRLGRYEAALAAHQRARHVAQTYHQSDRVAEITGNLALTFGSMGRFEECETFLQEAQTIARTTNNQLTIARMEMNLGELYTILGRPAQALHCFQSAREQFTALGNEMEVGSVALREAHLLERIGALTQACRRYEVARNHFQGLQMWPQVWQATYEAAIAKRRYGDYTEAAALLQAAAALWQQQQQAVWQSEWRLEQAAFALAQERLTTALEFLLTWQDETPQELQTPGLQARFALYWAELYEQLWLQTATLAYQESAQTAYQQLLAYAEQQGELRMKRQALAGLGRLVRQDDPEQAQALLRQAADQDARIRSALSIQELKAAFLSQSSEVLETLFTWAVEDQQPETALLLSWRAKGSALLELLDAHQNNKENHPVGPELTEVRNQLAVLQWQAAMEAQRLNLPQAAVEEQMAEIAQCEQRLIELRRQFNTDAIHLNAEDKQTPFACLAGMDADWLIEYMSAQGQIFASVIDTQGNCRVYHLTEVDTILDLLDELTLSFRALLTLPPAQPHQPFFMDECRQLLARGYRLLVRPLQLPQTATKLLIAPCVPLHKVPFAALWDGDCYWVEKHTIEFIPTGAMLTRPLPVAPLTQPLVIASSAGDALPANLTQVALLQRQFPTATCLSDDPNTLGYLSNLTIAPKFVHIAAHTLEREDAPIFTAMQLAYSTLSVERCYDLPLYGTELVTLSSCSTNAGMDSAGSLLAFQSAFFAAGVQRVLSTLWEIHSERTQQWMSEFYTNLQRGLSPAEALRQTQLTFLTNPQLCHPVHWAAFACHRR